jgi:hypothetical protein
VNTRLSPICKDKGLPFKIKRVRSLPSGAAGYAINEAGRLLVARLKEFIGTADWPTWIKDFHVYAVDPRIVEIDVTHESIVNYDSKLNARWPPHRHKPIKMFLGLLDHKTMSAFGGIKGYIKLNLTPAFYKFLNKSIHRF